MSRDREAWGHVTVVSIQHPLLEAHMHTNQHLTSEHIIHGTYIPSHTNFPLCTQTHTASEGRVKMSNAAPAVGQFGEQDEAEKEERE